MRSLGLILVLASCNQVFGIERAELTPPVELLDGDEDGLPDVEDNCPGTANPLQIDTDLDGPGDECDNCPLIANTSQSSVGDPDPVGDDCDPHPTVDGDCLVLFDRFNDPAAFAQQWQVLTALVETPGVEHTPDGMRITTTSGHEVQIRARDAGGNVITRDVELIVVGTTKISMGATLAGIVNAGAIDGYYGCGMYNVTGGEPQIDAWAQNGPTSRASNSTRLSSPPVRDSFTLRIAVRRLGLVLVQCRADYGVGVGAAEIGVGDSLRQPNGGAGVLVRGEITATMRAIALYETVMGTCPDPIVR